MADTEEAPAGEISKKQQKKMEKERQKAEKKAQRASELKAEQEASMGEDYSAGRYGDLPLIQSKVKTERKWTDLKEIDASMAGQNVLVRARMHTNRGTGKQCFIMLRQQYWSVQVLCAVNENISKQMVKFATNMSKESIVDIEGVVTPVDVKITSATQQEVEIHAEKIFVV